MASQGGQSQKSRLRVERTRQRHGREAEDIAVCAHHCITVRQHSHLVLDALRNSHRLRLTIEDASDVVSWFQVPPHSTPSGEWRRRVDWLKYHYRGPARSAPEQPPASGISILYIPESAIRQVRTMDLA